jgi:hypothetical protein
MGSKRGLLCPAGVEQTAIVAELITSKAEGYKLPYR